MGELRDSSTVEAALQRAVSRSGDPHRSLVIEVRCSPQGRVLATIVDQQQVSGRDDFGFAIVIRELPAAAAAARQTLAALGFADESDDGGDAFVAVCGADPIKTGQVLQAALIDALGLPAGEQPVARVLHGGLVTPQQRLERRIIRAAVRRGAVIPDSPAIATFLERHVELATQWREQSRRLEQTEAAAAELASLERELAQRQADVGMIDVRLSRLAPGLGTAAFAAFLAGRLARTPEFEERIALEEQLERLQGEHDALAPPPDAGFLARTAAVAQQLAVIGRIKIEELKIAGADATLGKRLLERPDPAALEAPETAAVLADLRELRTQREALLAEQAAVAVRLDAARAACPTAAASGPDVDSQRLRTAAADCRRELGHFEAEIRRLEEQFVGHLVYDAAIMPGSELGDLVERLRDIKRAVSGPVGGGGPAPVPAPGPPPPPARGPGVAAPISRLASQTAAAVDQLRQGVALPRTPLVVPGITGSPAVGAESIVDPALTGAVRPATSPAAFQACREALAAAGIPVAGVRLLFSCGPPSGSGSGHQNLHVAVTDTEWLVVPPAAAAAATMTRAAIEADDWKLTADQTGGLAWSCGGVEGRFRDPRDVAFVIAALGEAVLAAARRLVDQRAYFRAEALLERVGADWPAAAEAGRLIAALGRGPRATATFHPQPAAGGPGSPAADIDGHLQLDAAGMEFVPAAVNATGYLRFAPGSVLDFAVKPGQFPKAMVKAAEARRAGGTALKFATRFTRMMIDDPMLDMGTRIAGGAASAALSASADLGTRPNNRIVFLVEQDGKKRRLNFDMLGGSREEIERAATAFCEQAELFRERLGRRAARAPAAAAAPPAGEPTARVVGCPKCSAKLRVVKPGVVGCPKCGTKVRVSPELFQQRPGPVSRPDGDS